MSDWSWYLFRTADAEQAKSTGGMLALRPRSDFAEQLAVPGGEPPDGLHVTLLYFGEDVTEMPGRAAIGHAVSGLGDRFSAISARIMGHATFNPDGGDDGDKEPCAVYLVSDSDDLDELHSQLDDVVGQFMDMTGQHRPWLPHITAGYSLEASSLEYIGDVIFDRLVLEWAGQTTEFSLGE